MVVGVADDEFGQRVAAIVRLRGDQSTYKCTRISNGSVSKPLTLVIFDAISVTNLLAIRC
jgi:hypothetical protein